MITPRPTTAFVLGLTGGVLIVVASMFFILLFSGFFGFNFRDLLALIFGILVIVGSVLMYRFPSQHVTWGVIVLIFSIASIIGFGGFIAGLVLGIVGGALGIAWNPQAYTASYGYATGAPAGPYGMPVMPWRMCMGCGRWIPWAYNVCPLCGTQTPIAAWVPQAGSAPPPTGVPGTAAGTNPAYAAPAEATVKAPCPTCEGEAEWMTTQRRWFCAAEARYF